MSSNESQLSHQDIAALMKNPDASTKIRVIEKLSGQYQTSDFSEAQIRLAEQIFRLLLKQADIEVRRALSENLMHSKSVPHDVVLSLARDVEEVSCPVLEFSEVLNEDDVLAILRSSEKANAQLAIANRQGISERISEALVETQNEQVVSQLLQNETAKISQKSYEKVVETMPQSESVIDALVTRGGIPTSVIEHMTKKVSKALQQKLEKKYSANFAEINTFFEESAEMATLKFVGMKAVDRDLLELVDNLDAQKMLDEALNPNGGNLAQLLDGLEEAGQLTPLSGLISGHLLMFEICLARKAAVPLANVRKLSGNPGGMKALYQRAQLPPKLCDAVLFLMQVIFLMEEGARTGKTPRASKDLPLYYKNITKNARGRFIPNLTYFTSVIAQQLEQAMGEW